MARLGSRRRVIALVAVGAMALPLAALPATAQSGGETIKVMVIHEDSAGVANPEIPEGAIAAAEAFNKDDGIGGVEVEVLVCDTGNDVNQAAECGRQAVEEGVVALIGTLTPHSEGFMDLMAENKIASIGNVLAGISDFQSPSSFPLNAGIIATAGNLPRFLYDDGATVISVARPDLTEGAALKTFGDLALEAVGSAIENDVPVPTDAPDMSLYVEQALAGGTDGIVVALPSQQALNFVQAARQSNPDVKLAIISTEPGPVQEALGADAKGIVQALSFLPPRTVKTAEGKRFLKEIKAAGFEDSTGFRLNSWVAMQILKQVADGLPEVTAAGVFDALAASGPIETGLTPALQWTTPADLGTLSALAPRAFNTCQMHVRMTKGAKVKLATGSFFDSFTGEECETPS
jgi:ABC-type branched-subunit amino acid transport system substrate-binding protein